jgi:predicted RNA binding protein YcfA (HicA-like mRNA interferase family)
MPPLPVLKPKEVIKVFEQLGFHIHQQTGSHLIMIKDGSKFQAVVPMHPGDMKKGTLRAIIRQAGMTIEEFLELL